MGKASIPLINGCRISAPYPVLTSSQPTVLTCSEVVPPPNELKAKLSDTAIIQKSVQFHQNIV